MQIINSLRFSKMYANEQRENNHSSPSNALDDIRAALWRWRCSPPYRRTQTVLVLPRAGCSAPARCPLRSAMRQTLRKVQNNNACQCSLTNLYAHDTALVHNLLDDSSVLADHLADEIPRHLQRFLAVLEHGAGLPNRFVSLQLIKKERIRSY